MSGPSAEHERLVGELDDLAILAGYSRALRLGPGVIPDVARQDAHGHRFVGDAKSTELPTCGATFRRLARYARHMAYEPRPFDVLALALPSTSDEKAWLRMLTKAVAVSGRTVETASASRLDDLTLLVYVTVPAADTASPSRAHKLAGTGPLVSLR